MPMPTDRLAIEGGRVSVPPGLQRRWPEITHADRRALTAVLDRGQLWGVHAPEVTQLQSEYAAYCGARYCLAVNSGTAALHCALVGSGVQPGDEVIVPALSFVATPMAVLHSGATPVFGDIDERTFNIAPESAALCVTERTTALLPVHIHGLPADMAALGALARRHSLALIEDAAQAHGAIYASRKAGTLGSGAAFSLNGSKNLIAGEGGLYVTDAEDSYEAARRLAIFGEDTPLPDGNATRAYWSRGLGWNYRIHELTAALARAQLPRLDAYNDCARQNAAALTTGLTDLPGVTPPYIPPGSSSTFYGYRLRLDHRRFGWERSATEFRDRVLHALKAEGVAAGTWQHLPLPAQPLFRGSGPGPWHPHHPKRKLSPWDPAAYPRTAAVLDESLCIGVDPWPLHVQPPELMGAYVDAVHKVFARLEVVLSAPYEPLRFTPPIPPEEL